MIRHPLAAFCLAAAGCALAAGTAAVAAQGLNRTQQNALKAAIAAPSRTPANAARDRYRHPYETLSFFGVRPNHTVVEIWPGGGWYTEILAPYLRAGGGSYYAADIENGLARITRMMMDDPMRYARISTVAFPAFEPADRRFPDGMADVVLTFRNVHNWRMGYRRNREDYSVEAFRQMYAMLKPGGTLGVVDHRLPENADPERERTSGYVRVSTVRRLAEQAGFRFVAASEVNANPRDTADWPQGVWTLPPTLRLGEQDRARYLAVGESDRMTLRFVKPRR